MQTRPDDLANLCAIYKELGLKRIARADLERYFQRIMPLDSDLSYSVVLADAVSLGLIRVDEGMCVITDKGQRLSKKQQRCSNRISEQGREFMLKRIFLDPSSSGDKCADFLMRFKADTKRRTFVFYREEPEQSEDTQWLKTLGRVGLIHVDAQVAVVNRWHLGVFNEFLRQVRGVSCYTGAGSLREREKIGAIAEGHAMKYEGWRLSRLGRRELCPLIQQISLVDMSAGYDIASFCGRGKEPEESIYIEVKGTKKSEVDLIWTRNERRVAAHMRNKYWLYIYTEVSIRDGKAKGPIRVKDPIKKLEQGGYLLEPVDVRVTQRF